MIATSDCGFLVCCSIGFGSAPPAAAYALVQTDAAGGEPKRTGVVKKIEALSSTG